MFQLQAGYILENIRENFNNEDLMKFFSPEQVAGLLFHLTHFDVETNYFDFSKSIENINPLFATLNNLICRGLPTRPSIFVEDAINKVFGLFDKKIDEGTIKYENNLKLDFSIIFKQLHFIDNSLILNSKNYPTSNLGSNFESDFLFKYLAPRYNFFLQILETQKSLTRFVKNKEFTNQRVDFSIEYPYLVNGKRGLIIEIDGKHYHSDINQQILDNQRNWELQKEDWEIVRLSDANEIQTFIKNISDNQYFNQFINSNSDNEFYNQIIFIPFGIARVQKILVELILRGALSLNSKKWKIAVIERDIPCSSIAITDFEQLCLNLFGLENKNRKLPEIELSVFSKHTEISKKFIQNVNHNIKPIEQFQTNENYDLVLDFSILQRSNINNDNIICKNYIKSRSCHSIISKRKFYTSDLFEYRNIVKRLEDDSFETIKEAENHLIYFLQTFFRKEKFREGQLPILNRALQGKSVIGLLPTGGGKSLTYQLAVLLQAGVSLIVDPIKSLMKDQFDNLLKNKIDACTYINSTLKSTELKKKHTSLMQNAEVLFTFVSPERLQMEDFRNVLNEMYRSRNYFSYCILDEAHCVSEWGHDFRTSYLRLGENVINYCKTKNYEFIPIFGLTATASFDVLSDVQRELSGNKEINKLSEDAIIRFETTNRAELQFEIVSVIPKKVQNAKTGKIEKEGIGKAKQRTLNEILPQIPNKIDEYNSVFKDEKFTIENFDKNLFYSEDCLNAGLIFCPHRSWWFGVTDKYKNPERNLGVADNLKLENGHLAIGTFIGSDSEDEKMQELIDKQSTENQDLFVKNKLNVLVATKAFGMGIDKPNIKFTVHFNMPSSLESFVQEAGRAGRNRKLALSYILFNDDKIENSQNTQDEEILLQFHNNNFKGQDKEKVIIYELLNKITFPQTSNAENLSETISEEIGQEIIFSFNNQNPNQLYVNASERRTFGFFDTETNLTPRVFYRDFGREKSLETLLKVKELILSNIPEEVTDLKAWLQSKVDKEYENGIEKRLEEINIGEFIEPPIILHFNNATANKDILSQKLKSFIDKNITQYFNLQTIKNLSGKSDIKIFIEELEKYYFESTHETINILDILKQHDENQNLRKDFHFDALKKIYYRPRIKADTEKAIYRLSLVGVIDDYTVDFNKNQFTLYIKKKTDEEYKNYLFTFINKYFSEVKTTELIKNIENYRGNSVIQKCLGFLIDFIYNQIADQRKLAISTMKEACYVGLESGNSEFKTFIDLYFNSKYARKNYTIDGKDYSLRSDIDNNNQMPENIINKYIEAIRIDTSGEKNNLKHLRGACLVLQSAKIQNRDNPILLILKAFCLLLLEFQNNKLLEEASNDFLNGFSKLYLNYNDFEHFLSFVLSFKNNLLSFSKEPIINETIDNLINVIQIRIHTDWIEKFSPKFIENYEPSYSN